MKKKNKRKQTRRGNICGLPPGRAEAAGHFIRAIRRAQQLPALQTIPFQPLQIQQEPMRPCPLAPGCEAGPTVSEAKMVSTLPSAQRPARLGSKEPNEKPGCEPHIWASEMGSEQTLPRRWQRQ